MWLGPVSTVIAQEFEMQCTIPHSCKVTKVTCDKFADMFWVKIVIGLQVASSSLERHAGVLSGPVRQSMYLMFAGDHQVLLRSQHCMISTHDTICTIDKNDLRHIMAVYCLCSIECCV